MKKLTLLALAIAMMAWLISCSGIFQLSGVKLQWNEHSSTVGEYRALMCDSCIPNDPCPVRVLILVSTSNPAIKVTGYDNEINGNFDKMILETTAGRSTWYLTPIGWKREASELGTNTFRIASSEIEKQVLLLDATVSDRQTNGSWVFMGKTDNPH